MVMDKGWCDTTFLFQVEQGNSDGVELAGRTVLVAGDFPGPTLMDGNGTFRLYIDDGASADQQRELEGIFSGAKGSPAKGSPMDILAGLVTKLSPTQVVKIDIQGENGNLTASVGSYGVIKSNPMKDEAGNPTVIRNAMLFQHLQLGDPQIAPSGFRWTDPDLPRPSDTVSGSRTTFAWSGS